MNENKNSKSFLKRNIVVVNALTMFVFIIAFLGCVVSYAIGKSSFNGFDSLVYLFISGMPIVAMYLISKYSNNISEAIMSYSSLLSGFLCYFVFAYILRDNPDAYLLFYGLLVLSIFLLKKEAVIFAGVLDIIGLTIFTFVLPTNIPKELFFSALMVRYVVLIQIFVVAYITTKSINEILDKSIENENKAIKNTNYLNETIKYIITFSNEVIQSIKKISTGNSNLSQRTSEQSKSIEKTSAAIEELSATVKQNADNSKKLNIMSSDTGNIVNEGNMAVNETMTAMDDISKSSKKIAEIINVVNDIAFQTNLLALNAAVESARAGEHGRGFAVVAVEVRNLASRSAESAKEIQNLIKDSVEKISRGDQLVIKSREQLNKITESINNMSFLISEITAASHEQLSGIEEISKAISTIDQVVQQNTVLAVETSNSSQEVLDKSDKLLEIIDEFKEK